MPSGRIGNIRFVGRDKQGKGIYRVQVQTGSNANKRTASGTVHGSDRDAELFALALKMQLRSKPTAIKGMTLDEYFETIFMPMMERERRLAANTLHDYRRHYSLYIKPYHGSRQIGSLDEGEIRSLIERAGSQKNALATYRSIMNQARADRLIPHLIDFSHLNIKREKRPMPTSWSGSELLEAASKLRGEELVELYVLLGSAGLRKEETIALRPRDILLVTRRGGEKPMSPIGAIKIGQSYTDISGIKEAKTPEAERMAPMIPQFTERILELVEETKPKLEQVGRDAWIIAEFTGWKRHREVRYDDELFAGDAASAKRRADAIEAETGKPSGLRIKIERFGEGRWLIRKPLGYDDSIVKTYEERPFFGTEDEARRDAEEAWLESRLIPCTESLLRSRWKRALERRGLRYVEPNSLRHSSEKLMAMAGVHTATMQRMHGHTTFKQDFSYIDSDESSVVETAIAVGRHLDLQGGAGYEVGRAFL